MTGIEGPTVADLERRWVTRRRSLMAWAFAAVLAGTLSISALVLTVLAA